MTIMNVPWSSHDARYFLRYVIYKKLADLLYLKTHYLKHSFWRARNNSTEFLTEDKPSLLTYQHDGRKRTRECIHQNCFSLQCVLPWSLNEYHRLPKGSSTKCIIISAITTVYTGMASVSKFLNSQIPFEFILRSTILNYIHFRPIKITVLFIITHFPLAASNSLPSGHSLS